MLRILRPNKKLSEIIDRIDDKKLISVELNPYKTIDYNMLKKINPSFCSLVWIAHQNDPRNPKLLPPIIVAKELIRKGFVVLIHIPGIFYSKERMRQILQILKEYGVRNIFAMRGGGPWLRIEHCEFPFAQDFIKFIRSEFGHCFEIVIAGFPHLHPATQSMEDEMAYLRQKVLAGASLIITQACLSSSRYLNYRLTCTEYAIDIPIIFGLLMFKSYNDFVKIRKMGSSMDTHVFNSALAAKRCHTSKQYGRYWTKHVIRELMDSKLTKGIHIFTQNQFELAKNILNECVDNTEKANVRKIHKYY